MTGPSNLGRTSRPRHLLIWIQSVYRPRSRRLENIAEPSVRHPIVTNEANINAINANAPGPIGACLLFRSNEGAGLVGKVATTDSSIGTCNLIGGSIQCGSVKCGADGRVARSGRYRDGRPVHGSTHCSAITEDGVGK